MTKVCPVKFAWNALKATSVTTTPWNIISVHRNITIRLRRLTNPMSPSTNSTAPVSR